MPSRYETSLRHQVAMGDLLRQELDRADWRVVTETRLPVICFVDQSHPAGDTAPYLEAIARDVVSSARAWISTTRFDEATPVLKACITNYRTEATDVQALVEALNEALQRRDSDSFNE